MVDSTQQQTNRRYQDMDTKIFVGGLSWQTTEDDMKQYFTQFGNIKYCNIVFDHQTNRSRGYGFVVFESSESALMAIQNQTPIIGDKKANCNLASERAKPRNQTSGTNGGGNYRNNFKGGRSNHSNGGSNMNAMNGNYMEQGMPYSMGYVGMPYVPVNYVAQDPMMMMGGGRMDSNTGYQGVQYQNSNMANQGYNAAYGMGGGAANTATSPNRLNNASSTAGYINNGAAATNFQGANMGDQQYGTNGLEDPYTKQMDFYGGAGGENTGNMEGNQWGMGK